MRPTNLIKGPKKKGPINQPNDNNSFNSSLFAEKCSPKARKLIMQEKENSENIWRKKLESQKLTDPDFFLFRYSHQPTFPSNFNNHKKQSTRPVTVLSGKTLKNKPLYIQNTIPIDDSLLFSSDSKEDDQNLSRSNNNRIADLMSYADSENIESLFDEFEKASLVSQSTRTTILSQSTKKSRRTNDSRKISFSSSTPFSSPKKSPPLISPVYQFSRTAFFQPFPNRPIKTNFDETMKHERERTALTGSSLSPKTQAEFELNHSVFETPNSKHGTPYFLPDSRVPTRKEVNKICNHMKNRNRQQGDVQIPLFQKKEDRLDLNHAVKTLSSTAAFFEMAGMT